MKLSDNQWKTIINISTSEPRTVYQIGCSLTTIRSLVKLGLVKKTGTNGKILFPDYEKNQVLYIRTQKAIE